MNVARILCLAKQNLALVLIGTGLLASSLEVEAQVNRNIYNSTVRNIQVEVNPSGSLGGSCKDIIAFSLNGVVPIDTQTPGDPTFILDPVSPRLNDMYGLLMLAYATARNVQVITAVPVRRTCNAVIVESLTLY